MNLDDLKINEFGLIKSVGGDGALRQHFLDMGIIPGVSVKLIKLAPLGDPIEIMIHGYSLSIRKDDAKKIIVEKIDEGYTQKTKTLERKTFHPGFGEDGKYHSKKDENPLSDDTLLTFALVGNQNSGKTTLFNRLTGSNQHVGNFPGVTVEKKEGEIIGYKNTLLIDLPGIYSMSPYSSEEIVSRNFVLDENPSAIINIVDVNNIERNFYLTMQLLEMQVPMVIALNMMDEFVGNGGSVDINTMEALLGVPIIPISASKNEGIEELVEHAYHIAKYQERPNIIDLCDENDYGGSIYRAIHSISHLLSDDIKKAKLPLKFSVSKIIENDKLIYEKIDIHEDKREIIENIISQMEKDRGLDRSAAMADLRFNFIRSVVFNSVIKPKENKQHIRSEKIDRILTGKYTAIPTFILIMLTIFYLTFNVVGLFFQNVLDYLINNLSGVVDVLLTNLNVNNTVHSLIIDGIFNGVGSVVSFLPIIVTMFFFLSLLEDSGYIARVAFVMDKLLRKIGLSGRSIVPLLIGFGCSVPAVMATRTLPSKRDRKLTILLTPFMSCSAKLPIYAFFVNSFFKGKEVLVMSGLYILGVLIAILIAYVYKDTAFKGEAVPFVMELPNYRFPTFKNVKQLLIDKSTDFIYRAFSIILLATIVVWFLSNFSFQLNLVSDTKDSILAIISGKITYLFKPLGLDDYRVVTALITGFMAKESVVSTIELLFSSEGIMSYFNIINASTLLVFSLLYAPCIATISSIKRELNTFWAIFVIVFQTVVAWIIAYIVKLILLLFI